MVTEIAFSVYPVTDIARARAFYEGILGLVPNAAVSGESPWIEYDIGAGTFAIGMSSEWKPSAEGASVAFELADFDAAVQTLKDNGVPFTLLPQDYPSCHMAIATDPDGTKLILHKRK